MRCSRRLFFNMILLLISCLILAACGPIYKKTYTYVPPHSWHGKRCVSRCMGIKTSCKIGCRKQQEVCRRDAQRAAKPAYKDYLRSQRKKHKSAYETINDFADYSNCNQSCGCQSDYRQCYRSCGGQIIVGKQCVMFCKKDGSLK